ncbi:hypothetical protein MKW94_007908 [Papaver nudicaule]|uniref:RRM domain-containing protein n=1 Tax=Papaver nudicaule TaxID=74823 RepID=A0AA41VYF4_PAPNU|nr:hypothetical protein [Papaver nudicaule]
MEKPLIGGIQSESDEAQMCILYNASWKSPNLVFLVIWIKQASVKNCHLTWVECWLVRMLKLLGKAQMVDYCAQNTIKGLGEVSIEMDAHISWKTTLGVPGVKSEAHFKTKRLFVTGLSFYTSGKTLRAAFESFGDLVECYNGQDFSKIQGYAFTEYTTEEVAGAALKEMNGKIINGWMILRMLVLSSCSSLVDIEDAFASTYAIHSFMIGL